MDGMNLTHDIQIDLKVCFALVVLEIPNPYIPKPKGQTLDDILGNAKKRAMPSQAIQSLEQNVWLIPLHTDILFLSHLLAEASNANIPLHILFLHERPDWIKQPPAAPNIGEKSTT